MCPSRCLRLAMLNADTSIPNTYATMGTFGDILHHVLSAAASRISKDIRIEHEVFDVVRGEWPPSIANFDAIIITASSAASYDHDSWIRALQEYVLGIYTQHPDVKIFGSCFGHHLVCQALLKDCGVLVEPHPNGWEVGVSRVHLTEAFRSRFASLNPTSQKIPESIRLQFVHADQVVFTQCQTSSDFSQSSLPEPWTLVGSTEHCAVQGVYFPGRVLTLQGHFEFDKFENQQTMRIFGAQDFPDDGDVMAEMVVQFLLSMRGCAVEDEGIWRRAGLGSEPLTPRSSMEIV
ncbi:class I glutamine amidotransferase-like protein [Coniella lustricola]|uniref:Class I glutamine amidotransferase-like protein n=1 Tax=Coniella lustricola TaxID=2025994 RepID=A0A2T2ZVR2_9PEZI|nr:class I glutamine amidotransferase-like protein [Coniella lustricola]